MKLNTMMVFKSIVCIITGIIFLIFPGQWLWLLNADLNSLSGTFMARLFGATFVLVGLLMGMARDVSDPAMRRAIILSVFVGDGLALIVSLIAQLSGVMNPFGWGIVIVYALLTLGFGYLQFAKSN
jgi:uncharacterized protein YjeT (DUF2065 family)